MDRILDPDVAAVFAGYPPRARRKLLALRKLIFETAAALDGVGDLEETLKWGEPAYVTSATGSGTTIRIDWKKASPDEYSLYVHCGTDLIDRFRAHFAGELAFDGNRRIVLYLDDDAPADALSACIAAALTYHANKRR